MHARLAILLMAVLMAAWFPATVVADDAPQSLTIATWNIEWFFDHRQGDNYSDLAKKLSAPNEAEWKWRLEGVADAIARLKPDILALQEIENQRVLYELCTILRDQHGLSYHDAIVQGRDFYTEQDVAFLWRSGLVEYSRKLQSADEFSDSQYHSIAKFVVGRFMWGRGDQAEQVTVINVHLTAMPDKEPIRIRQARLLRKWFGDAIARGENVIILGDINTNEKFSETDPNREVGILRGLNTPDKSDDLVDLHRFVPSDKRYTHLIYRQFDRILLTPSLGQDDPERTDLVFESVKVRHDVVVRGRKQDEDHWDIFYDIPQDERDLSDHYPVVAKFRFR